MLSSTLTRSLYTTTCRRKCSSVKPRREWDGNIAALLPHKLRDYILDGHNSYILVIWRRKNTLPALICSGSSCAYIIMHGDSNQGQHCQLIEYMLYNVASNPTTECWCLQLYGIHFTNSIKNVIFYCVGRDQIPIPEPWNRQGNVRRGE